MAEWRGGWRTKTAEDGHPIAGDGLALPLLALRPRRQLHGYRCARHPARDDRLGRRHAARREVPATSPLDAVHAYAGPGTCAATLQIDDDAGATSLATLSVPVSTPIAVLQAIVADLDCPCIDSRDPDRHPRAVPAPRRFRVGLVQMRCAPDPAANLDTAIDRLRQAARQGAQVICLPELFRSQYFCQREDHACFDLAESVPGPTTDALGRVATEIHAVVIASIFERRAAGVYHNTAVVLDADGSVRGLYRKMHIPDDPLYYEKFYFTPGDLGFRAFDTAAGRIGTLVCWDQWYPEAARLTALAGADVLFYPTAIGWHPREKAEHGEAQVAAWQTMQRAHAIANGVYVAAANRVGHEGPADGGLEFWGASFVCDPFGVVLQEAPRDAEAVLVVECDLAHQEEVRRNWPFLRDRRIDAYAAITKRLLDG